METVDKCTLCKSSNIEVCCESKELNICNDCKFVFNNPRPTYNEVEKYYSNTDNYDNWIDKIKGRDKIWVRRLNIILKFKKSGKLLDISAGIGEFLNKAKNHYEIYGTEISQKAIDYAKQKYDIDLARCDFGNYNSKNTKYDVITVFHVLEHVHEPAEFINKCYRLLEKEGILVIAVPNDINSLIDRIKKIINCDFKAKYPGINHIDLCEDNGEMHLSHFTSETLKYLLEINNFKIIKQDLDQHLESSGLKRFKRIILFGLFKFLYAVFKTNYYETILVIAKK